MATMVSVAVAATLALASRAAGTDSGPRLLPVPLISQATPWTCGPASLMAALVYFGVFDEPESRLDDELGATPEDGVAPARIAAEARLYGLDAEVKTEMSLADLAEALGRGAVVIAALQAWPAEPGADLERGWENGHYVVVVGLDARRVYAMDPSVRTGYAYLTRDAFVRRWHDYDVVGGRRLSWQRLGIVLTGPRPLPRYPAEPTPIE
ncbi:MAG TPA: C39 family peptidase [Polyangia bacterium]|nr:C39 family peptidase [Polyangia bacterium]